MVFKILFIVDCQNLIPCARVFDSPKPVAMAYWARRDLPSFYLCLSAAKDTFWCTTYISAQVRIRIYSS